MARSDSFAGLTEAALDFLRDNQDSPDPCPTCGHQKSAKTQTIGHFQGMFGDEYPLERHFLKDGRTADEFLQAEPWASGPVFFIGLRLSDGSQTFEWSDEEIQENL